MTIWGTISCLGWGNWDFAWFCWDFNDISKMKFWRKSVDESAYCNSMKYKASFSFCYPHTLKATVFLHFSVGLITEQMFDKIRSGLLEQNIFEHVFVLWFYRIFENLLLTTTINYSILHIVNKDMRNQTKKDFLKTSISCWQLQEIVVI